MGIKSAIAVGAILLLLAATTEANAGRRDLQATISRGTSNLQSNVAQSGGAIGGMSTRSFSLSRNKATTGSRAAIGGSSITDKTTTDTKTTNTAAADGPSAASTTTSGDTTQSTDSQAVDSGRKLHVISLTGRGSSASTTRGTSSASSTLPTATGSSTEDVKISLKDTAKTPDSSFEIAADAQGTASQASGPANTASTNQISVIRTNRVISVGP